MTTFGNASFLQSDSKKEKSGQPSVPDRFGHNQKSYSHQHSTWTKAANKLKFEFELRMYLKRMRKKEGGSSASSLAASAPIKRNWTNLSLQNCLLRKEIHVRIRHVMDLQSTQFIGMKSSSSSGPIHPAPVESRQWEKRRRKRKQLTCKHWNLMKMKSRRRKSQSQQIAATINSRTDTEQQYHGEELSPPANLRDSSSYSHFLVSHRKKTKKNTHSQHVNSKY